MRWALLWASLLGPATTILAFFVVLASGIVKEGWPADARFTIGYAMGMGLTILIEGLAAVTIAALICVWGLVIFGMPLSGRFGSRLMAPWTATLGLILGGFAGGLLWLALSGLFSGLADGWRGRALFGVIFGAPTGFWWWFFYRRVLIRRAALEN